LLIDRAGVDPMQAFAGAGDLEGGLAAQFSEAPNLGSNGWLRVTSSR